MLSEGTSSPEEKRGSMSSGDEKEDEKSPATPDKKRGEGRPNDGTSDLTKLLIV